MKKTKVAVVGLGYVGLPLAVLAKSKGHDVFGIDKDPEKVELINKGKMPFEDDQVGRQLKKFPITSSTEFDIIKDCQIVVICVPTPVHDNYMPNLEPVKSSSKKVGENLSKDQLIILESTVNPGVSEEIVIPILEQASGKKLGKDFYFAHCPERINPGDKKWNVENINRVVGANDKKSLALVSDFYRSILTGTIKEMSSLKEAEAVKVVENSFRDINIAFVNELARSFHSLGIDVVNVIDGAATKPFSFMPHYPGCGVGGHCIPVDPYYLIEYAKKSGFDHDFLSLARKINNQMPRFAVDMVIEGLNQQKLAINGSKVVVFGLSYKQNIDDCRESPSFKIIKLLQKIGARVVVYDPHVKHLSDVDSLEKALKGAKAILIATCHDEFKNLTVKKLLENGVKVVADGRNCLNKNSFKNTGIVYKGIGR
ncbi:MAG: UDP-N-acetyl-D-glucosamine 6-dehydrogenase [candidate division WS2 bacterium ADurb.Bin280]|uniref:UDP-N-acetyl-D-glucosamine 6-dehydrogenase n=1 Tax=candidate division WS2 bacterium ADurb.Bin280 TaxID=1852829 RepID=A0A1V5SEX1_9BACT|nr:MAG: UDP-N-acetyl-D-glucosamine 6-dehydrogenase [candidate division WS2 bacterium ADurb.Bin280]